MACAHSESLRPVEYQGRHRGHRSRPRALSPRAHRYGRAEHRGGPPRRAPAGAVRQPGRHLQRWRGVSGNASRPGLVYYNPLAPERLVFWVASHDPGTYAAKSAIPTLLGGGNEDINGGTCAADLLVMDATGPTIVARAASTAAGAGRPIAPDRRCFPLRSDADGLCGRDGRRAPPGSRRGSGDDRSS